MQPENVGRSVVGAEKSKKQLTATGTSPIVRAAERVKNVNPANAGPSVAGKRRHRSLQVVSN